MKSSAPMVLVVILIVLLVWFGFALVRVENERYALQVGLCTFNPSDPLALFDCLKKAEICHELTYGPLAAHENRWKIDRAVGSNGLKFGVWHGKGEAHGALACVGMALVFKREDAARLEFERVRTLSRSSPPPRLFFVSAWTIKDAASAVLDQVFSSRARGAERIM